MGFVNGPMTTPCYFRTKLHPRSFFITAVRFFSSSLEIFVYICYNHNITIKYVV